MQSDYNRVKKINLQRIRILGGHPFNNNYEFSEKKNKIDLI